MSRRSPIPTAAAAVLSSVVLAAGCGGSGGGSSGGSGGTAGASGRAVGGTTVSVATTTNPAPTPKGTLTVPIDVIHGPGNSTLALVPVEVDGKGPFRFALDTGASQSLISTPLARRLGLQVTGHVQHLSGVVSSTNALQVKVTRWNAGSVKLPSQDIVAATLGAPLQGLLGSDVLHLYDVITVDYAHEQLRLHPRGPGDQPARSGGGA